MAAIIRDAYEKFDEQARNILSTVDPLLTATIAYVDYEIPRKSVCGHFFPLGVNAIIKYKNGELQNNRKLISEESRLRHLGVTIDSKNEKTNEMEVMIPTDLETLVKVAADEKIEHIYRGKSK